LELNNLIRIYSRNNVFVKSDGYYVNQMSQFNDVSRTAERFSPTFTKGDVAHLSTAQLGMLLESMDWRMPKRTWRPEVAGAPK